MSVRDSKARLAPRNDGLTEPARRADASSSGRKIDNLLTRKLNKSFGFRDGPERLMFTKSLAV